MKPKHGLIPTIALVSSMAVSGFLPEQTSPNLEQRLNTQNHSQYTESEMDLNARIAFTAPGKNDNCDLWVTDGSTVERLTNSKVEESYIQWSPDGERIYFQTDFAFPTENTVSRIKSVDLKSGNIERLYKVEDMLISSVDLSPDGSLIAFSESDYRDISFLVVYDIEAQTSILRIEYEWNPGGAHISWLDNNELLFSAQVGLTGEPYSTEKVNVQTGEINIMEHLQRPHDLSPDRKKMIVRDWNQDTNYIINLDGTERVQLSSDRIYDWLPDGRFISGNIESDNNQIFLFDNVNLTTLLTEESIDKFDIFNIGYFYPSPHGEQIVFSGYTEDFDSESLYLLDLDGSNLRKFDFGEEENSHSIIRGPNYGCTMLSAAFSPVKEDLTLKESDEIEVQDKPSDDFRLIEINQSPVFVVSEDVPLKDALVELYNLSPHISEEDISYFTNKYLSAIDKVPEEVYNGIFMPYLYYEDGRFIEPLDFPIQIRISNHDEIVREAKFWRSSPINERELSRLNYSHNVNIPRFNHYTFDEDVRLHLEFQYLDSPCDNGLYDVRILYSRNGEEFLDWNNSWSTQSLKKATDIYMLNYNNFDEFNNASEEEIIEKMWELNFNGYRKLFLGGEGYYFLELNIQDFGSVVEEPTKAKFHIHSSEEYKEKEIIDWNYGNLHDLDPKIGRGVVSFDMGTTDFDPNAYSLEFLELNTGFYSFSGYDCRKTELNPERLFCNFWPGFYEPNKVLRISLAHRPFMDNHPVYQGVLSMP